MKYELQFKKQAERDMEMLLRSDKSAFKKLERLLNELKEHPRTGTGKPEQLRGSRSGQWSRRITDKHRLVYVIDDDKIIVIVLVAAGHYD